MHELRILLFSQWENQKKFLVTSVKWLQLSTKKASSLVISAFEVMVQNQQSAYRWNELKVVLLDVKGDQGDHKVINQRKPNFGTQVFRASFLPSRLLARELNESIDELGALLVLQLYNEDYLKSCLPVKKPFEEPGGHNSEKKGL